MTEVARLYAFDEDDVFNWCQRSDDWNPVHHNDEAVEESQFPDLVVPGMMMLDRVSGLLTQWSEAQDEDGVLVLGGITAARFREPVVVGEEIEISVEDVDDDGKFTYLDFEIRSLDRDVLTAHGTMSVTHT